MKMKLFKQRTLKLLFVKNVDFDPQHICQSRNFYENMKCSHGHHGLSAPDVSPKEVMKVELLTKVSRLTFPTVQGSSTILEKIDPSFSGKFDHRSDQNGLEWFRGPKESKKNKSLSTYGKCHLMTQGNLLYMNVAFLSVPYQPCDPRPAASVSNPSSSHACDMLNPRQHGDVLCCLDCNVSFRKDQVFFGMNANPGPGDCRWHLSKHCYTYPCCHPSGSMGNQMDYLNLVACL
jgi:hypothetical protein